MNRPKAASLASSANFSLSLLFVFTSFAAGTLFGAGCGRSGLIGNGGANDGGGCVGPTCADLAGIDGPPIDMPPFNRDLFPDGPPNNQDANPDGQGCSQKPEICDNNSDDNCNGLVDCADPQCNGNTHCIKPGVEICNNGIDDDNNGLIDCADPACKSFPGCQMMHMCNLMMVDCADPACITQPQCQNLMCHPTVNFGTLQPADSRSEQMLSTIGTKDVTITPCAPGGGGMVVTEFVLAGTDPAGVRLDYKQSANSDHVFSLFHAGVNQVCNANWIECFPNNAMPLPPSGNHSWVLTPGHYYLIVQAFTAGHQGTVDAILSTGSSKKMEICNNGVDDDGNGLIDCADPACFNDANCKTKECKPEINLAAIVANAAGTPHNQLQGKKATINTIGAADRYTISCGGRGGDYAVEFSLKETAGIGIDFTELNGSDQVVSLFRMPPAGQACDAQEIPNECFLPPNAGSSIELAFDNMYAPGNYLVIFKAVKKGTEGPVDIFIYAYKNANPIELCHNGVDDDNNGLIDCADPACFADAGCGPPACMPDVNFGTLNVGQQMSTTVDLTNGVQHLVASCAKGGGKSRVIQLKLPQVSGLGIDCAAMGGKAVVDLLYPGGLRDSCDKNELSCADPATIPFGCNFEWPNLQPGDYYLMVTAFQAGTESKVSVTLSAIKDRALEICNNKIDDDMDGFTDCADKKCALSPYCAKLACKADVSIDPMPLDGSMIIKSVDTTNRLPLAQPSCEVKQGGGTAVVYVNMPGQGNLSVDYIQGFGSTNHVFQLLPDAGQGLICEASGKDLGCQTSGGKKSGNVTFNKVPAGKYWLIVAADQPGDEGQVFLDFTAKP